MTNVSNAIHGLLLPVYGTMLLPHATVAEVITHSHTESVSRAPVWLTGMLSWRGGKIPLIFFESMCGEPLPDAPAKGQKIAVLKTLGADPALPFIALVVQGIPRTIKIDIEELADDTGHESAHPFIAKYVRVKGQSAYIPNMDSLEDAIKRVLVTIN